MERKELVAGIRKKYQALRSVLDERQRRLWAASEAQSLPHGGVSVIAQATGLSRSTVHSGMRELSKVPGKRWKRGESGESEEDASPWPSPSFSGPWRSWWHPPPEVTRNLLCVGRVRARASWRKSCNDKASALEIERWPIYSIKWNTVCKATPRPSKGAIIRIATLSLSISMLRPRGSWNRVARSFPWTLRRRNWWETSATTAKSGVPKQLPKRP